VMRVARRIILLGLCASGCLTSLSAQPPSDIQWFAQRVAKSIVNAHHSRILIAYSPYCSAASSACVAVESALQVAVRQSAQNVELVDQKEVRAAVSKNGFDAIDLNSNSVLKDMNPELSFDTLVLESVFPSENQGVEINCSVFDVTASQFLAQYNITLDPLTLPKFPSPATSTGDNYGAFPTGTIPIGRAAVPPSCISCQLSPAINEEGSLDALITITSEGRVENITLVKTTLKRNLDKALQTFATWRFAPAKVKGGKPVSVVTSFEITFREH